MRAVLVAVLLSIALGQAAFAEVPRVVATIKPIHSLVAVVMGDLGSPDLIVRGGASPHTYSLRPSDAAALENAGVIFWTGHGMELFLEDAFGTLAPAALVVELADAPGIELLPIREGGAFEVHGHDAEGHDQENTHGDETDEHAGEGDMHYWLDPANAKAMLAAIADALSATDPDNAATYALNAQNAAAALDALIAETEAALAPVRDVPFVVFHDAYQYFERRFGLTIAGSITVTPDTMPGAARIAEIRAKLAESRAACVFAEPQFEPAIVATIIEGSAARSGTLDPEGSNLDEGPDLYPQLVGNLSAALVDCLAD